MSLNLCQSHGQTSSTKANRRSKKGFTLTEIAIVLGIIGLILGAIWVAAASVYSNLRTSKATNELLSIAQGIRALYATSPLTGDGTVAETSNWQAAGVFPSDMISGGSPVNPWNYPVAVYSATVSTAGDSFAIVFTSVPTASCISLLTATTGPGRDSGLVYASAGAATTTAPTTVPTISTASTFPVTASTAAGTSQCSQTGGTANITWGFKLKG